jgi:hypothetical protein
MNLWNKRMTRAPKIDSPRDGSVVTTKMPLFDSPQKTNEFYTRFTVYDVLEGQERTKGLIDFCTWIYKNSGGSLMEAVLNKELEDDTPSWKKRAIIHSIVALSVK